MIELSVSLASNGVVKVPGYEQLVRFGYTKNRGVYRLHVDATGEWEGLIIRAFWHLPGGSDPASSLVVDGLVGVPASVTAQPGNGCITFEGSDGTKTVTSADLHYRVSANSGTEDGSMPEPGTPAWQELVGAVHADATAAEQAKTDAQTAAQQAGASAEKAGKALSDTITAKEDALVAIGTAQATATQAVDTARDKALQQVEASTEAAQTAASEAATSAGNADQSAQAAAGSLQALKDGIASGDFKGEPGTSPTVTVQDITGGHRIVITDETGTSSVDVLNGKQGDPGRPGDTGATPELTIGTVEEGDTPSATITGTAKNPVLNLTLKSGAPGKDATVDDTLSQSGKAADAKVTGDALATKAVIDDTTVGTDAWSSKHIVDMLCPPISETGNPVVCYPVAGSKLGCKVSWEPTQEGSGDPSPDNIRPIKGRDSVTVTRCGEALWSLDKITLQTYNSNITTEIDMDAVNLLPRNVKLYFSGECSNGALKEIRFYDGIGAEMGVLRAAGGLSTVLKAGNIATVQLYAGLNENSERTCTNLQITLGTTPPTAYAPYTGQTATLTLPRTIYGGTVDAVTGEGQETRALLTLTGTERIYKRDKYNLFEINLALPVSVPTSTVVASHWSGTKTANTNALYAENRNINVGLNTCGFDTVDDLKSYLAAQYAAKTPVQIAYKLATPVPFTATGAQPIPALPGVNTVLTDADSVTVTGRADPIKRITDLEDAVASMTNT